MTIDINIQKSAQMPLHAQIRKQILSMIESGALQQDSPIPPEMELVEKYRISRTVVRHALNDLTDEGYLYRIRGKGTFVSAIQKKESKASDLIAIVMPSQQTGSMFSDIIVGSQAEAAANGLDMIYSNSRDTAVTECEYIERLKDKVRGLILFLTDNYADWARSKKALENLRKENIPFVLIDRHIPGFETDFVGTDNFTGAYDAVTELIREAYDDVACVICSDWQERSALVERLNGYKKAVKDNGRKEIILEVERKNPEMPTVQDFLKKGRNKALFTAEIQEAVNIAGQSRLVIPGELGIIGFDKVEVYTPLQLSVVAQPMKAIGENAAKLLIERIKGNKSTKPMQIRLKPELILNKSTRCTSETKRRAS